MQPQTLEASPERKLERTTIECHECSRFLTVEIDLAINGNHVAVCPCGHEHYRVVKDGKITDVRWASNPTKAPKDDAAQRFKGSSAIPLGPPEKDPPPVKWTVATMSVVYCSFTLNSGGNTITGTGNATAQGGMFLQSAWANTIQFNYVSGSNVATGTTGRVRFS